MEDKTPATMELHTDKFLETGNFSYAMSAFCRARANGHPIPDVILESIEKAFLEWGENDGKKTLDEILKLKAGSGNQSILSKEWKKARNKKLFTIMATCVAYGWKEKDAAEVACIWAQAQYEANPKKYKWLKPNNSGRKEKDEDEILINPDSLMKERRNNKELFREAERNAAQHMILSSDQKKEKIEKFYLSLICSNSDLI